MVSSLTSQVGTERKVITDLPGPKSQELHARRKAAVSAGLTVGFPIYIDRAEGAILLDVDGNQLLDMGSGIAVTGIGHAVPALIDAVSSQVAKFTHTCFMVTPYESYVEVCEALSELTPGDALALEFADDSFDVVCAFAVLLAAFSRRTMTESVIVTTVAMR